MNSRRKIYASLIVFAAVYLIGVAGFKIFGGPEVSLLDCVYMTAITISTIGYGEVVDMSHNPAGRIFTITFIILSLGTIAFAVSSITAFIVEGELKNILGRRRMGKDIAKLKDHYIVCGSDETAQTVIRELVQTHRDFIVVEPSKEKLDRLAALGNFPYIQDDPAEDVALMKAGIDRARGIFPCLATDEANLFVTITARSLNPRLRIVAKGLDPRSHDKIKKAGADSVISPAFIGGMRLVSEMVRPAVVGFLDMMLRDREKGLRVEEVEIDRGSPLAGKTIREAEIAAKTGALLVAVRKSGTKDYEFNPPADLRIEEEDVLIFMGNPEMAAAISAMAGRS
jgi:voltage-gated potassium channel